MIREYFGKDPIRQNNSDEAVAFGAAIQGAILSRVRSSEIDSLVILDVTPYSLGIETTGGVMQLIVPRNSTIPTKKSVIVSTEINNQQSVMIKVFEGERQDRKSVV